MIGSAGLQNMIAGMILAVQAREYVLDSGISFFQNYENATIFLCGIGGSCSAFLLPMGYDGEPFGGSCGWEL